jgi:hypothetical protein
VNGNEVIGIYGDRHTVIDGVSRRIALNKGPNIRASSLDQPRRRNRLLRRFLDADDKPLNGYTVSVGAVHT